MTWEALVPLMTTTFVACFVSQHIAKLSDTRNAQFLRLQWLAMEVHQGPKKVGERVHAA